VLEKDAEKALSDDLWEQTRFWARNAGNGRAVDVFIKWMQEANEARIVDLNRKGIGEAKIRAVAKTIVVMDVQCALEEFSKTIKLQSDHSELLQSFAKDFAKCRTSKEMVRKEAEIRNVLVNYLPKNNFSAPECM
jgi:hypothetical protein